MKTIDGIEGAYGQTTNKNRFMNTIDIKSFNKAQPAAVRIYSFILIKVE